MTNYTPEALYSSLSAIQVRYQRCDHPPVYTVAEAAQIVPAMPGTKAKNLFLRDSHSTRMFLVVVPYEKRVDLAKLASELALRKLRFASADDLMNCLGVTAGAVSILALFNDRDQRAELIVDEVLAQSSALQAHPLVNTATLSIPMEGLRRFLECTGHAMRVMDVPARTE